MNRTTRRALLAGTVATAGIAALEYGSLSGRFDHRGRPASQDPTARFRYATSIATLDATPAISTDA